MLYCGSGNGRINSGIVAHILKDFFSSGTPIFYVISNLFSHSEETLSVQVEGALKIMTFATQKSPQKFDELGKQKE